MKIFQNLYFLYMLELRALQKAAPYFRKEFFYTGNTKEDEETRRSVAELVTLIDNNLPEPFDESQMFKCGVSFFLFMKFFKIFNIFWRFIRFQSTATLQGIKCLGKN